MTTNDKPLTLKALHEAPEILRVVNVWDAISAKVVADLPGTKTIVDAVDLPVSADLDDGYSDPAETIRRAIGFGVVGANVEDRLRPFEESVARVAAIVTAAEKEGVAFQLNARTDAIARAGDRPIEQSIEDAIARGAAFLDAGAALVFVPGAHHRGVVEQIVAGL